MSAQCEAVAKRAAGAPMSVLERWLTLWVALCIVAGVALGDLVGKYINIASRAAPFLTKLNGGCVAESELTRYSQKDFGIDSATDVFLSRLEEWREKRHLLEGFYENRDYAKATREIMAMADEINAFFNNAQPWKLVKDEAPDGQDKARWICSIVMEGFRLLTIYLKPILPAIAQQAEQFLNMPPQQWEDAGSFLLEGHRINEYSHLMTRVEGKQVEALVAANRESLAPTEPSQQRHAQHQQQAEDKMQQTDTISIDDFMKVDLRIARIAKISFVPQLNKDGSAR